jgi:hypothetical protein
MEFEDVPIKIVTGVLNRLVAAPAWTRQGVASQMVLEGRATIENSKS